MSNKNKYLDFDCDNNLDDTLSDDYIIECNEIDDYEDYTDYTDDTDEDGIEYIVDNNIIEIEENVDFDLIYKLNTNKHKQDGKHSLKRDTIFKGKLDNNQDLVNNGYCQEDFTYSNNESFKMVDVEYDRHIDDYINQNNLTKDVFNILEIKTDIDFKQNRRKPNRELFNNYFNILINDLGFRYTKSELFVELSYYFTDNIFNMFKILDKTYANTIIKELIQKGHLKNLKGVDFL